VYVIVRCGGRQEKASVDDVLTVDKLAGEVGSTLTLPALLVVDDDNVISDPAVLGSASPTEKQVCLVTLQTVFASKCAATLQQTPCLCGTTDSATCLAGTATPTGAAYDIYACDFQTTSSTAIQGKFMPGAVETTGAAQGTAIIQCLGAFGCNSCFGQ